MISSLGGSAQATAISPVPIIPFTSSSLVLLETTLTPVSSATRSTKVFEVRLSIAEQMLRTWSGVSFIALTYSCSSHTATSPSNHHVDDDWLLCVLFVGLWSFDLSVYWIS